MTISAFASGTQTATIGSEHFLANVNAEGKFTGIIDVSNMVDGDILELRAYQMVLTGGTPRLIDYLVLYGVQPTEQLIVEWGKELKNELTDAQALRYSLKQTAGTGRQFPWKVVRDTVSGGGGGGATAAEIWDYLLANITTANTIGKLLKDNINATISSRSSHTAADVWAVGTRALTDKAGFSLSAAGIDAIWDEEVATGHTTPDTAGAVLYSGYVASASMRVQKNTTLNNFMFFMRQSLDHVSPATGLSVTAQRSIDGGLFAACANPVTEVGDGVYKINLAASDLNGNIITLKFTAAGADQRTVTIITQD